jgi:tellurite resistance protein
MFVTSKEVRDVMTNSHPGGLDTIGARPIPPNIFGIGFGLAGLGTAWRIAVDQHLAPHEVSDVLIGLAALAWLISLCLYLRYALTTRGALRADLHDMTVGPFASLAVITPILLAADGVAPYSRSAAAVIVDISIVLVVLLGGWFTGIWMRGGTDLDRLHPGYFLPTVAGGLVASAGAAMVDQQRLAQLMLGLGIFSWIIVGSMILGRLIFRPPIPDALAPTMAIEVAPAAVASVAYFFMHGAHITTFVTALAGYGLLMVVAQIPLLGRYARLKFSLATWAFTFSWAAVASTLLFWIDAEHVSGGRLSATWCWPPSACWSPPSEPAPWWLSHRIGCSPCPRPRPSIHHWPLPPPLRRTYWWVPTSSSNDEQHAVTTTTKRRTNHE